MKTNLEKCIAIKNLMMTFRNIPTPNTFSFLDFSNLYGVKNDNKTIFDIAYYDLFKRRYEDAIPYWIKFTKQYGKELQPLSKSFMKNCNALWKELNTFQEKLNEENN